MSNQEFNKLYEGIRYLSQDAGNYDKSSYTKKNLIENLISALKCLDVANQLIIKQNDSIMTASNELSEQSKLTRREISQSLQAEPSVTSSSNKPETKAPRSFSDIVKGPPTIVVKPTGGATQVNREDFKQKAEAALKDVKVANARISERGNLVVEVPSSVDHSTATENLKAAFPNNFTVESPKKVQPKLTITNLPNDYTADNLIPRICEKDQNLEELIKDGEELSVIKTWSNEGNNGEVRSKKFAVKCSPKIREYVMNANGGYLYLNMCRSKVYDRFFVTQCYHCQSYNHIASKCPNKDDPPVCCNCAGRHSTKYCKSNYEKCNNCSKAKLRSGNSHKSNSPDCPIYGREREFLIKRTDYNLEKN